MADKKSIRRFAATLTLAAFCTGCASDGASTAGSRPKWFASWFGPKPSATKTYEQYLAEQQQRSIVSPGMGLEPKAEPGPLKKMGNSIASSSAVKTMKGWFGGGSSDGSSENVLTSSESAQGDPLSLSNNSKKHKPDFWVDVARQEERAGSIAAARTHYQKALELDSNHQGARLAMARFCDRQGELAEATRHYVEAVKRHPNDASALNDLALCYARQDLFHESATTLEKAVALRPDYTLYRNNLATVLVELNRIDDALAALSVVHGKAVAHYNLGYLLEKRGQKREALVQFEKAVAADPKFDAARSWVDALAAELHGGPKSDPIADRSKGPLVPALPASTREEVAPEPSSPTGPALELTPPASSRSRAPEDARSNVLRDTRISERPLREIQHLPSVESATRRR